MEWELVEVGAGAFGMPDNPGNAKYLIVTRRGGKLAEIGTLVYWRSEDGQEPLELWVFWPYWSTDPITFEFYEELKEYLNNLNL